jgi:zinc protease
MLKQIIYSIILSSISFSAFSNFVPDYEKLSWEGVDVIFVKDDRVPMYQVDFYFSDGALSDQKGKEGETELMFDLLTSGTRSFSQKEINDNLEYYGASYGHHITHEYATYSISGLKKDIVPTLKQVCHLFSDASFPENELRRIKKLKISGLKNISNDHGSVADRAFRKISLGNSVYETPSGGTVKSIARIKQKDLKQKLKYFKNKVKKRIYIKGHEEIKKIKEILVHDCQFDLKNSNFKRIVEKPYKNNFSNAGIYLVTVPSANQAQVRIGRLLKKEELGNDALLLFTSKFLGGGFTSQLMQSVRVKSGLSYSVSAFAAGQKEYGRSGIMTFTKNDTIVELLDVIKSTLSSVENKKFSKEEFEQSRGYLVGSFPFSFEQSSHFMQSLIQMDHQEKPHEELFDLPAKLGEIKMSDVAKMTGKIFDWKKQTIVIVGPKSLKKKLKTLGKVKVIPFKKFL